MTREEHGPCDYNGGPGSDQCPHGVYYVERDHRAEPVAGRRGLTVCRLCGRVVRTWPDGRFPVHASA